MSENQLVPQSALGGDLANQDDIDAVLDGGDYLPYFRLYVSNTDQCKQGKIPVNHYGFESDSNITDLGQEVDVVILATRLKAVQTGDDFVVDYHPEIVEGKVTNPTFLQIMAQSKVKDSGAMWGPEVLLWIPSTKTFVTWHLNSKTARREAKSSGLKKMAGNGATLKSKLIDPPNMRFSWQGPVIVPCSAPLEVPSVDEITEQVKKFLDPPRNQVEMVQSGAGTGEGQRVR